MKDFIKKVVLGKRASSESYISYLRKLGMQIGEDVTVYVPSKTVIDEQYPWMIKIGNHVRVTEGVKILTHDYSWSVLKTCGGMIAGASGMIDIGNNVFIGIDSIILRNVKIGDNVIIGTGSVVTKDCEPNSVYAGVPARRIMSLDEYTKKRMQAQANEAKQLALRYFEVYKQKPNKEVFHEYFMLFESPDKIKNNPKFSAKMDLCGNSEVSYSYLEKHKPMFENYEQFLEFCFDE